MLIFQGVDAWYSGHIPCLSAACFKWTNLFHLSPWSWRYLLNIQNKHRKKLRILSRELMFFQKQGKFRKLLKWILSLYSYIFSTPSKYRERPKCRTPMERGLFWPFFPGKRWRSWGRKRKGCHCLNQPFFGLEENKWTSVKKNTKFRTLINTSSDSSFLLILFRCIKAWGSNLFPWNVGGLGGFFKTCNSISILASSICQDFWILLWLQFVLSQQKDVFRSPWKFPTKWPGMASAQLH